MKLAYTIYIRFPLYVQAGSKELVLALNGKVQGARVPFSRQLSGFPRFGGPERENWVALIYEQEPVLRTCTFWFHCYRPVDYCKTTFRSVFLKTKQSAISLRRKTLVIPLLIATCMYAKFVSFVVPMVVLTLLSSSINLTVFQTDSKCCLGDISTNWISICIVRNAFECGQIHLSFMCACRRFSWVEILWFYRLKQAHVAQQIRLLGPLVHQVG